MGGSSQQESQAEHCCPEIDDDEWELKEHSWEEKTFVSVRLPLFFHIPLVIGRRIGRAMDVVDASNYRLVEPVMIMQRDGLFSGRIMVPIEKPEKSDRSIEALTNVELVSKVHKGPYSMLGDTVRGLSEYVNSNRGVKPKTWYFWYVNCPKCAEKQGGPKTVVFAQT